MSRRDFGWDYPPGVTGREPEIAGWPEDEDGEPVDPAAADPGPDPIDEARQAETEADAVAFAGEQDEDETEEADDAG